MEEETDTQRQSRLISQALVTVEKLAGVSAECSTPLYEQFSKPAVLAALMNMAPNVRERKTILMSGLDFMFLVRC